MSQVHIHTWENGARAVGSHVTHHESEARQWSVSSVQWLPLPKIQTLYSLPEGYGEATGGTETYSLPPRGLCCLPETRVQVSGCSEPAALLDSCGSRYHCTDGKLEANCQTCPQPELHPMRTLYPPAASHARLLLYPFLPVQSRLQKPCDILGLWVG